MNKRFILLILASLLAATLQQSCSPSFANDQLQTGTYTFSLSSNAQRVQCYTTPLPSSTPNPQIFYGISNILNYQNSNGVDFSVRGRADSISQLISFSLITNNNTYGSLTISYLLIGNRNDFISGSYIADTNALLQCNAQQSAIIPIPVTAKLPATNGAVGILIFINGIRTQSWLFNLVIQQPLLDLAKNQINITVKTDAGYPIQTVFFSYLVMDLNKIGQSYTYSFTSNPIKSDFSFSGIFALSNLTTQVQYGFINLNKTNLLSCAGFSCNACISPASCSSSGGSVLGTQCLKCTQNQVFSSGVGCICRVGFFSINGTCASCPSNSLYNPATQSCVSCGSNTILANGKCTCSDGFFNISGSCQKCPSGTIFNSLLSICSPRCSGGQQLVNGVCSCASGTFLINGNCGICSPGSSYNSATLSCIKQCTGANQILVNGQCACNTGFILSNNVCVAIITSTCSKTQILFLGKCYECPPNSSPTSDQKCMCNPGYQPSSTSCELAPALSSNTLTFGQSQAQPAPSGSINFGPASNFGTGSSTSTNSASSLSFSNANAQSFGSSSSFSSNGQASSTSSASSTTGQSTNSGSSSSSVVFGPGTNTLNTFNTFNPSASGSSLSQSSSFAQTSQITQTCPVGTFSQANVCQTCSPYCLTCFNRNLCQSCSIGFTLSLTNTNNVISSFCNQICGDGLRFALPCDDGNNINGDGCSSVCTIQSGWTCLGGSSNTKDTCSSALSSLPSIAFMKNIIFVNALYQDLSVTKLPESLTSKGCIDCPYLLNASVRQSPYNGTIAIITFITGTQYRFMLTVIFPNRTNLNGFAGKVIVDLSLNSSLSSYFPPGLALQTIETLTLQLSVIPVYTANNPQISQSPQGVMLSTQKQEDQLSEQDEKSKTLELMYKTLNS